MKGVLFLLPGTCKNHSKQPHMLSLCALLGAMLAASLMLSMPLVGGAAYLAGRSAALRFLPRHPFPAFRLLIRAARPLYRHRIIGRELVQPDQDMPSIFICNHGEIYGPVAAALYMPYAFRPWTASEMMNRKTIASRICAGMLEKKCAGKNSSKITWGKNLPGRLCFFLADKVAAPFLCWVMKSAGSIPVYHNDPRRLMLTFRETVAAMENGENILIFPENAAATRDGKYQRKGVSQFFTGFTMAAQLYHRRTGKCCQFIPLYANKEKRTITFGNAVRYNPENHPAEEKERLCRALRGEMLRLSQR